MQRPGLEPETPTWQAGTLPNYANAAKPRYTLPGAPGDCTPLQCRVGQEGIEPSCDQLPFLPLIRRRGYCPLFPLGRTYTCRPRLHGGALS